MQRRALALFSGGLDSILAAKIIQNQGIDILAINFTSPFFGSSRENSTDSTAARYASIYGIPFRSIAFGDDYLEMLKNPIHGYGSGLNPCIDCKSFMLRHTKKLMDELKADFIITGEVVGQRPMSQRKDTMRIIERDSGLDGLLLRPLSARYLKATRPEIEGWVKRDDLPAIKGRGRKDQMLLAAKLGIHEFPGPGGGCLLAEESYIPKVKDLLSHQPHPVVRDFELLRTGRHFRISDNCKAIVGRDSNDNDRILSAISKGETILRWPDGSSPTVLITGEPLATDLLLAGRILLRYTRFPKNEICCLTANREGETFRIEARNDISEDELESFRISVFKPEPFLAEI